MRRLEPRDALVEAVRRMDPAYANPDAMVLLGNFAGEAERTPELLDMLREHAVEPCVSLLHSVLSQLQEGGAMAEDIDKHTIFSMCVGSYFSAFYRGESNEHVAEAVVAVLRPVIAVKTSGPGRRTTRPAGAHGESRSGATAGPFGQGPARDVSPGPRAARRPCRRG